MWEWMAISLAGAIGGLLGTCMPSGSDVPWPKPIQLVLGPDTERPKIHLVAHAARNGLMGCLAGFVVWSSQNIDTSFFSHEIDVHELGIAVTIGLAGTILVNRWTKAEGLAEGRNQVMQNLMKALASSEDSENGQGTTD